MKSNNQHADRPRSTVGNAPQRSSRRPSQPRFVLQPVVLDDTVTSDRHNRYLESTGKETGYEAAGAEEHQRNPISTSGGLTMSRDAGNDCRSDDGVERIRIALLDRRAPLAGRPAIIGALFVCSVIAIALLVTLLLTGRTPIAWTP